jgi:hypothetical protein
MSDEEHDDEHVEDSHDSLAPSIGKMSPKQQRAYYFFEHPKGFWVK